MWGDKSNPIVLDDDEPPAVKREVDPPAPAASPAAVPIKAEPPPTPRVQKKGEDGEQWIRRGVNGRPTQRRLRPIRKVTKCKTKKKGGKRVKLSPHFLIGEGHACASCEQMFESKVERNRHEREFHNHFRRKTAAPKPKKKTRPVKKKKVVAVQEARPSAVTKKFWTCPHCQRKFLAFGRHKHLRSHFNNFPFKCTSCSTGHASKDALDQHKYKLHRGLHRAEEILKPNHEQAEEVEAPPTETPERAAEETTGQLPAQPVEQPMVQPVERLEWRILSTIPTAEMLTNVATTPWPTVLLHPPGYLSLLVDELHKKPAAFYFDFDCYRSNFGTFLVDLWVQEPAAKVFVLRCDSPHVDELPQLGAAVCSSQMIRSEVPRALRKSSFAHVFVKPDAVELIELVRDEMNPHLGFGEFVAEVLPALRLPSALIVASPADRSSVDAHALAAQGIAVF